MLNKTARWSLACAFALALASALCIPAQAQTYPAKPITVIVPFAGGGPTDTVARLVASAMAKDLGVPVNVDNIGGAGGTLGSSRAAKAVPDGYTLLLNHMGHVTAPFLYSKLPYDPIADFAPIGRVADVPMTLVARKNMAARNFPELLAWLRSNGKKVNYSHAGLGAVSHLCGLLLMKATGVEMTAVAYKGTGPAMTDLLSGQIDLMCDQTTNTEAQIKAGNIKVYAVTTRTRLASMKDVPTLAESGLKNFELTAWHGLYAPKGTPAAVVDRLSHSLQKALQDPALVQRFAELDAQAAKASDATPQALAAWQKTERDRWGPIITAAGVHAE